MSQLLFIIKLFSLIFIIKSDICTDIQNPNTQIRFIQISDREIYIIPLNYGRQFYRLNLYCIYGQCRYIENSQLSIIDPNNYENSYKHNDYIYVQTKRRTVEKFDLSFKSKENMRDDVFWQRIPNAIVTELRGNQNVTLSKFVPPRTLKTYGFIGNTTIHVCPFGREGNRHINRQIEAKGYSDRIIWRNLHLYSYDNYIVPAEFDSYFFMPNDDIVYVRGNKFTIVQIKGTFVSVSNQPLDLLFGCGAYSKRRNIYPENDVFKDQNIYDLNNIAYIRN